VDYNEDKNVNMTKRLELGRGNRRIICFMNPLVSPPKVQLSDGFNGP
jgi:hypothetical protein